MRHAGLHNAYYATLGEGWGVGCGDLGRAPGRGRTPPIGPASIYYYPNSCRQEVRGFPSRTPREQTGLRGETPATPVVTSMGGPGGVSSEPREQLHDDSQVGEREVVDTNVQREPLWVVYN